MVFAMRQGHTACYPSIQIFARRRHTNNLLKKKSQDTRNTVTHIFCESRRADMFDEYVRRRPVVSHQNLNPRDPFDDNLGTGLAGAGGAERPTCS